MEIQIIPIHLSYSHSNFKSHALNFQAFLRHLPEYFNAAPRSDNFFLLELLFCQIPYSPTETPSATCAVTEEASLKLLCQFYFNVQIIASLFLKVSYSNALLLSSGIPHVNIYHFNTDVLEVAVPYLPFTGHYWTCRQWMTFRPDTFLHSFNKCLFYWVPGFNSWRYSWEQNQWNLFLNGAYILLEETR